jgi:hypothetical protein
MIKNFEEIKHQLRELATAINSFKSEAVQLRIVELILADGARHPASTADVETVVNGRSRRRRQKSNAASTAAETAPRAEGGTKRSRKTTGSGPVSTLNDLLTDGFFAKKQTLSKIIEHCKTQKARLIKQSDLSGPLAKSVRDGRLKRQKNDEGQYEYWKP